LPGKPVFPQRSIHNTYPDIAHAIRARAGKDNRSTLAAERFERKRLVELLRLARVRLKAAEKDVALMPPKMPDWSQRMRFSRLTRLTERLRAANNPRALSANGRVE
jgi:hypothetical protein